MSTNKKKPTRTCMGCNESKEKNELLRIVKSSDGEISVDLTGKKNGRGAYICKNEEHSSLLVTLFQVKSLKMKRKRLVLAILQCISLFKAYSQQELVL